MVRAFIAAFCYSTSRLTCVGRSTTAALATPLRANQKLRERRCCSRAPQPLKWPRPARYLEDGDVKIGQGAAILQYLCKKHGIDAESSLADFAASHQVCSLGFRLLYSREICFAMPDAC